MITKLKYRKIRGIDKEICTCEQKIAYNMAFQNHISFQENFNAANEIGGMCLSSFISDLINLDRKEICETSGMGKYNLDAIISALRAGLKEYLSKPFIASDYEQIGKCFPAYYL